MSRLLIITLKQCRRPRHWRAITGDRRKSKSGAGQAGRPERLSAVRELPASRPRSGPRLPAAAVRPIIAHQCGALFQSRSWLAVRSPPLRSQVAVCVSSAAACRSGTHIYAKRHARTSSRQPKQSEVPSRTASATLPRKPFDCACSLHHLPYSSRAVCGQASRAKQERVAPAHRELCRSI